MSRQRTAPLLLVLVAMLPFTGTCRATNSTPAVQSARAATPADLEGLDQYLKKHPGDVGTLMKKGVLLAEQNRINDAIKVFSTLTRDHPYLPEPYNNLAVLYAAQGRYEDAKNALESALRTNPSYDTAYRNLGDIYAKLASQAYDKALEVRPSGASTAPRLALIKDIHESRTMRVASASTLPQTTASTPVITTPPVREANRPPPQPALVVPSSQPKAEPVQGPQTEPRPGPKPAAAAPAKAKITPKPEAAAKAMPEATPADTTREVLEAINAWAKAWSDQNVKAYLAAYGANFQPPGGESREHWEKTREARVQAPKHIQVALVAPKVSFQDAKHATVVFQQIYRSDSLRASTVKTLELRKAGGKWFIEEERVGR